MGGGLKNVMQQGKLSASSSPDESWKWRSQVPFFCTLSSCVTWNMGFKSNFCAIGINVPCGQSHWNKCLCIEGRDLHVHYKIPCQRAKIKAMSHWDGSWWQSVGVVCAALAGPCSWALLRPMCRCCCQGSFWWGAEFLLLGWTGRQLGGFGLTSATGSTPCFTWLSSYVSHLTVGTYL